MDANSRRTSWLSPVVALANNWISLIGIVVVTAAGISWLILLPTLLGGATENPYIGILGFLILPVAFVLGLLIIPLGIFIRRSNLRKQGAVPEYPVVSFANPAVRRILMFIIGTTAVNIVVAAQWSYAAVNYMDSSEFCGTACHNVMRPEYTAHQVGAHTRVECIKCHAGSGASGFVKAKLAGVHQLISLVRDSYSRPIPVPIANRPPAEETCGACHSLGNEPETVVRVVRKFGDDEKNSPTVDVLAMRVRAIHRAHMRVPEGTSFIRYSKAADGTIPWLELTKGQTATVFATEANGSKSPDTTHQMDCIDCHSRPAHSFQPLDRAVDAALAKGDLSPTLPFAKKQAMALLNADYPTREEAQPKIVAAFRAFYQQTYPAISAARGAEIERSANAVAGLYMSNVFPDMRVGWGTYANQLGHTDATGCFRCHDFGHSSPGGDVILQDCTSCHTIVAMDEASPAILGELGLEASK